MNRMAFSMHRICFAFCGHILRFVTGCKAGTHRRSPKDCRDRPFLIRLEAVNSFAGGRWLGLAVSDADFCRLRRDGSVQPQPPLFALGRSLAKAIAEFDIYGRTSASQVFNAVFIR